MVGCLISYLSFNTNVRFRGTYDPGTDHLAIQSGHRLKRAAALGCYGDTRSK